MGTDLTVDRRKGAQGSGSWCSPASTITSCDVDNLRACYDSLESPTRRPEIDGVTKAAIRKEPRKATFRISRRDWAGWDTVRETKRRSYIPKAGSAERKCRWASAIWKTRSLRHRRPSGRSNRSTRPYSRRAAMDTDREATSTKCLDESRTHDPTRERINYMWWKPISRASSIKVNHEWMVKFLRHRIGDERVIRLIIRMLKSGILEGGLTHGHRAKEPRKGSILSPLFSNVYLHYVLDLWFRHRRVKAQASVEERRYYFRFADDFLACFQYRDDAAGIPSAAGRTESKGFGLKAGGGQDAQCIEFGRFARETAQKRGGKPKEFTFLGFTHYCGKDPRRLLQGETPNQPQEAGRRSAQVHGVDDQGSPGA